MYRTTVLSACLALAFPAFAADIYRCVDAQGRVEYRDEACSRTAGQTGSVVILPPLNIVRDLDQSAARAAANAAAARKQVGASPGIASGAIPLWQIPGGLPVQDKSDVKPEPPIVTPAPTPPSSMPANATSTTAAGAMGNPTLPPATPPKAPPALPVNATSGAAAAATGVAGR